ncbi:MAG: hypothetical protein ACJAYU_001825 [Bradymonadia bacterium]|jgi:hypothetical protein
MPSTPSAVGDVAEELGDTTEPSDSEVPTDSEPISDAPESDVPADPRDTRQQEDIRDVAELGRDLSLLDVDLMDDVAEDPEAGEVDTDEVAPDTSPLEYPSWGCTAEIFGNLSPSCVPPGEQIPSCNGWVRGEEWCEITQVVRGPLPDGPTNTVRPPQDVRLGRRDGDPVAPENIPELICSLSEGCPELVRTVQYSSPRDDLENPARWGGVIATASEHFVVQIEGGMRSYGRDGAVRWTLWPLGHVHRMFGIPGTDDVIVHWTWHRTDEERTCWINPLLSRIDGTGNLVWTRGIGGGTYPRYEPRNNQIFTEASGWNGSRRWVEEMVIDASTGELIECSLDPWATSVIGGFGTMAAYGHIYATRGFDLFRVDGGTHLATRPARDPGSELDPAEYFYGGSHPSGQVPFLWYDGSILNHDGSSFFLSDPETFETRRTFPITERYFPDHYRGDLQNEAIVDLRGTIWQRWDHSFTMGIWKPFPGEGEASQVIAAGHEAVFHDPVVAQDGTILYKRLRPSGEAYIPLRAVDNTSDGLLWQLNIPEASRTEEPEFILLDDGMLVVFGRDGVTTWWQTVHGGLANTPAPRQGFDNYNSYVAPVPPFATEPEVEVLWRW